MTASPITAILVGSEVMGLKIRVPMQPLMECVIAKTISRGLRSQAGERLIGSIRRECVDHVIVFGEQHLRRLLRSYQQYYNGTRTHLSLAKDSPVPRCVHATGSILPLPILGGLHHHYVRI